jgi:hypothetical protein
MLGGSVDINAMEKEYEALKAPSTHALSAVDTSPSPTPTTLIVGQPEPKQALMGAGVEVSGGVEPPNELESNTLSSSLDFLENSGKGDDQK